MRKSSFFLARAEPRVSTEGPVVEPSDLGCVKSGTVGEVFTDHVTRVRAPALGASELFPETFSTPPRSLSDMHKCAARIGCVALLFIFL